MVAWAALIPAALEVIKGITSSGSNGQSSSTSASSDSSAAVNVSGAESRTSDANIEDVKAQAAQIVAEKILDNK